MDPKLPYLCTGLFSLVVLRSYRVLTALWSSPYFDLRVAVLNGAELFFLLFAFPRLVTSFGALVPAVMLLAHSVYANTKYVHGIVAHAV